MYKAALSEHPSYSEEGLRIIFVEDVVDDAELVQQELRRSGLASSLLRVDTEAEFLAALQIPADVILCDFSLPDFDGLAALRITREQYPHIPFIFVSGTIGEELAIQALRQGAYDYVLKDNIARLPSSVRRALRESHERAIRRRTEEILFAESKLLSAVFDSAGAVGVMLDAEGRIFRFNQAGEKATGYASNDIQGLCFWDIFFPPTQAQNEKQRYLSADRTAFPLQFHNQWLTRDGQIRTLLCSLSVLENDQFKTIFILSGIDITQWQEAEERVYRLSHFDQISGLPNRAVLRDRLEQAALRHDPHAGSVVHILLELNGMARVRDALGAQAGVALAIAIAGRLQEWKPPGPTTVAQYADRVFAVLIEHVQREDVDAVVQHLLRTLEAPYSIAGQEDIHLQPKIGIALYPDDTRSAESLFHFSEVALHRAQTDAHEHTHFYTRSFNQKIAARHALANQLRQAIQRDELVLHYQPQVSLKNGKITGFEALVRWRHPERGLLMPAEFIPLAEESETILALGEWVLRAACRQCKQWQDQRLPPVMIAVNLSAMQFNEKTCACWSVTSSKNPGSMLTTLNWS